MLETVRARPTNWEVHDKYVNGDQLAVRSWLIDNTSTPHLWRIDNFPSVCSIELPLSWNGKYVNWNASKLSSFHDSLMRLLGTKSVDIHPFSMSHFSMRIPLQELRLPLTSDPLESLKKGQVGKVPILYIYGKTLSVQYDIRRCLTYKTILVPHVGNIKVELWEAEVDSVTKLLAFRDIARCDWMSATGMKMTGGAKISTCENEYVIDWTTLSKIPDELTSAWECHPGILSFDIEVTSSNHNKFPDLWDRTCPMFMISCNFKKGKSRTRTNLLVYGDCDDFEVDDMDVKVIRVKTELELKGAFKDTFDEFDPDIITGFRIQSFDLEYMDARFAAEGMDWPVLGRLKGVNSFIERKDKQSGAYGFNKIYEFCCPGRIVIDAYQYFRREYKYPEYNLNFISKKILKEGKHDISPAEMFRTFDEMMATNELDRDDPRRRAVIERMTDVARYCVQDSQLVIRLFEKTGLWISILEMSNVMCVNPYSLYTSGQQIRCFNQLYTQSYKSGVVITRREGDDFKNKGGKVQKPKRGLYDVMTIDFNSLYPSIIIANNVCYTTYVRPVYRKIVGLRDMCNIVEVEFVRGKDTKTATIDEDDSDSDSEEEVHVKKADKKVEKMECWFIKDEYVKGLLPTLVGTLIGSRRAVQALLKKGYDVALDKKQNAYKVSANSFFGFLDATMLPFFPAAAAVTSWGRKYITETNNHVVKNYDATVVYGDTDSSMIHPRGVERKDYAALIKKICDEVTALFPDAIVMKPEYCAVMFAIMPKKYVLLILDDNGDYKVVDGEHKIEMKGVLSARRDNCSWARETFGCIINSIIYRKPYAEMMCYLIDRVKMITDGQVDYKDLLINKSVGTYTDKSKNTPMKVFSERLRDEGKKIEPGERLYYLVIEKPDEKVLGNRMVLEETYIESLTSNNPLRIDYVYYVRKVLMKHVDTIIPIAYPKHTEYLSRRIKYVKSRVLKSGEVKAIKNTVPITMLFPVELMCIMVQNDVSLDTLKADILSHLSTFDESTYLTLDERMENR